MKTISAALSLPSKYSLMRPRTATSNHHKTFLMINPHLPVAPVNQSHQASDFRNLLLDSHVWINRCARARVRSYSSNPLFNPCFELRLDLMMKSHPLKPSRFTCAPI